jgi:AraC-like DNA-binding protein
MLKTQEHLLLKRFRLRNAETLEQSQRGLVFLFSQSGAGKATFKGATHGLQPGDLLVFDSDGIFKIEISQKSDEFQFGIFSVCFENLLPLFGVNEIGLLHNVIDSLKTAKLHPARNGLAMECQRLLELVPPLADLDHRGQLVRIAATILSEEFKGERYQRSRYVRAEDNMLEVLEKLSAAELINLSVSEMASKFSCSSRHLNRLFQQRFGFSVAALRMEMRLLKAISLLRDPDIKIIDVAGQCGFHHLGLFNTCFKRRFGSSPGQWRQLNRQSPAPLVPKPSEKPGCPLVKSGLCPLIPERDGVPGSLSKSFSAKMTGGILISAVVGNPAVRTQIAQGPS